MIKIFLSKLKFRFKLLFKRIGLLDIHHYFLNKDNYLPHSKILDYLDHREYIGGNDLYSWFHIGKLQYHFLVDNGLKPSDNFLDIACGSLRLGQFLIPMLDKGKYYGIDGEKRLIADGLSKELLFNLEVKKTPNFSFNYDFDFSFCKGYDFAIAQSLFTHLNKEDINKCFKNLSSISKTGSKFFFTFFEGVESNNVHSNSHSHRNFEYCQKL